MHQVNPGNIFLLTVHLTSNVFFNLSQYFHQLLVLDLYVSCFFALVANHDRLAVHNSNDLYFVLLFAFVLCLALI